MTDTAPNSAPEEKPPIPPSWDLSKDGGINTDLLRILIEERNFHYEQIMAINGRLGWVILALAASVYVAGGDLRTSLEVEPSSRTWIALSLSGLFLMAAVYLTANAVIEHWRMRMVWVRRLEHAIACFTHGMSIEDSLAAAEKIRSTRPEADLWRGFCATLSEPLLFSALPDLRPCELSVTRYQGVNSHMRFGVAASMLLLSAFFFVIVVLS